MMQLFMMGGVFMFPLTLIALALVPITIRLVWKLANNTLEAGRIGEISLQALPFWGVVSLLIGFLGQASGIYKGLGAIAEFGVVNPKAVYIGLRESMVTTLYGLEICIVAMFVWGMLRIWHTWRTRQAMAATA